MQIRKMKIEDKDAVMELYHALTSKYHDNVDAVKLALAHPATEVFVVEEDSRVVGTATFSHRTEPLYGLVGHIADVVVHPNYQRRGFGKELSRHLIEVARQKGCKQVELTSKPEKISANEMYQELGFVKKETNFYVLEL